MIFIRFFGGMAELVEGAALEMRYVRKGIGGSNPSPTAKINFQPLRLFFISLYLIIYNIKISF